MAVVVKSKRGKDVTLLNPNEKGNKAYAELAYGVHMTNDGRVKTDKAGNATELTDTERAYRSGYLAAQKDSRKAFRANNPNYKSKTKR